MSRTTYVATVHWRPDFWIATQLGALERHVPGPLKIFAYLNDIDAKWQERFDLSYTEDERSHGQKLNHLAEEALRRGKDDDIILFVDGDAFPIADVGPLIEELSRVPLIAVQRLENCGDPQPHPCFCLTTLGFWRSIAGDWQPGGYWTDTSGRRITDVGGRVLASMGERRLQWKPLLRSNARDLHRLWFGVYGDVVYHHGAGFRGRMCRVDARFGNDRWSRFFLRAQARLGLRRRAPKLDKWLTLWIQNYMQRRNKAASDRVLACISEDPEFFRTLGFIGSGVGSRGPEGPRR